MFDSKVTTGYKQLLLVRTIATLNACADLTGQLTNFNLTANVLMRMRIVSSQPEVADDPCKDTIQGGGCGHHDHEASERTYIANKISHLFLLEVVL